MTINTESLRAKLLNISREKKISLQDLLNRFGSEQFLARMSVSPYADRLIFKGGSLLTYLIETDRRTQDLDFSAIHIANSVEGVISLIDEIKNIEMDDGIAWGVPEGHALDHPMMDYPGFRIKCPFMLDKARGLVRIDFGIGDVVSPKKMHLERMRYKGEPLVGSDFDILVYPTESIFAEKLHIAFSRGGANTRMKDYYDMYKLALSGNMNAALLKSSIEDTFKKRGAEVQTEIAFDNTVHEQLQRYWDGFLRKMGLEDAPRELREVIDIINKTLKEI